MFSNFERFLSSPEQQPFPPTSQPDYENYHRDEQMNDYLAQQRWAIAMQETVFVAGCTCPVCTRHAEIGDEAVPSHSNSDDNRSLPSTRDVIQVLYPLSYLGIQSSVPEPPPYSANDPTAFSALENGESPSILPMTTRSQRLPPLCSHPLTQGPPLTGVPSPGFRSSRALLCEPIAPSKGHLDTEPLPAYSRFDQRRPRFPVASDVLGPYPPLPLLSRTAR